MLNKVRNDSLWNSEFFSSIYLGIFRKGKKSFVDKKKILYKIICFFWNIFSFNKKMRMGGEISLTVEIYDIGGNVTEWEPLVHKQWLNGPRFSARLCLTRTEFEIWKSQALTCECPASISSSGHFADKDLVWIVLLVLYISIFLIQFQISDAYSHLKFW